MKKWFIFILLIVVMAFSALPAFADEITLPYPDIPYKEFMITYEDGIFATIGFNDYYIENGQMWISTCAVYLYDTNEWVFLEEVNEGGSVDAVNLLYDTTGFFLTENRIELVKSVVSSKDFNDVYVSLSSQVSVDTVVEVLVVAAGVAVGLVFMWWGVRKLAKVLMKAFKQGKIHF